MVSINGNQNIKFNQDFDAKLAKLNQDNDKSKQAFEGFKSLSLEGNKDLGGFNLDFSTATGEIESGKQDLSSLTTSWQIADNSLKDLGSKLAELSVENDKKEIDKINAEISKLEAERDAKKAQMDETQAKIDAATEKQTKAQEGIDASNEKISEGETGKADETQNQAEIAADIKTTQEAKAEAEKAQQDFKNNPTIEQQNITVGKYNDYATAALNDKNLSSEDLDKVINSMETVANGNKTADKEKIANSKNLLQQLKDRRDGKVAPEKEPDVEIPKEASVNTASSAKPEITFASTAFEAPSTISTLDFSKISNDVFKPDFTEKTEDKSVNNDIKFGSSAFNKPEPDVKNLDFSKISNDVLVKANLNSTEAKNDISDSVEKKVEDDAKKGKTTTESEIDDFTNEQIDKYKQERKEYLEDAKAKLQAQGKDLKPEQQAELDRLQGKTSAPETNSVSEVKNAPVEKTEAPTQAKETKASNKPTLVSSSGDKVVRGEDYAAKYNVQEYSDGTIGYTGNFVGISLENSEICPNQHYIGNDDYMPIKNEDGKYEYRGKTYGSIDALRTFVKNDAMVLEREKIIYSDIAQRQNNGEEISSAEQKWAKNFEAKIDNYGLKVENGKVVNNPEKLAKYENKLSGEKSASIINNAQQALDELDNANKEYNAAKKKAGFYKNKEEKADIAAAAAKLEAAKENANKVVDSLDKDIEQSRPMANYLVQLGFMGKEKQVNNFNSIVEIRNQLAHAAR